MVWFHDAVHMSKAWRMAILFFCCVCFDSDADDPQIGCIFLRCFVLVGTPGLFDPSEKLIEDLVTQAIPCKIQKCPTVCPHGRARALHAHPL